MIMCVVMARTARLAGVAALLLSTAIFGCKDPDQAHEAPTENAPAAAEKPAPETDDESLLSRRDTLLATRLELRSKQAELAEKREAIREKGGDTTEVDRESAELVARETAMQAEEKSLLDHLMAERQAMVSALAASRTGGGVPGREAAVAAREKDLSRREQRLADREAQLASREEGLATKWKAQCAAPTTIVQTVDAKGTRYTRRDVEPLLARARSEMNKKGVLHSDLPPPARDLEGEATRAMEKGDYGQARFAANQLYGTVKSMKVDKAFIADKIRRLNEVLKGQRLSGPVEQLFRDATQNVADGNFASANRKLNRIHAAIN
jgi:hypothetical protein